MKLLGLLLVGLVACTGASARMYSIQYVQSVDEHQDSSDSLLPQTDAHDTATSTPFSWILSMLDRQRDMDSQVTLGQQKGCNHAKAASSEQGGWKVNGFVSQDFHYDGSSSMNPEDEEEAQEEEKSPYDQIDEAFGSDEFNSARSRLSNLGLPSLISSLLSFSSHSQMEEPVRYEPTSVSSITYLGPFVFFSSFSSDLTSPSSSPTLYYTGEYIDIDEDDEYVESDESIAYYFQGIYDDSSYAYDDVTQSGSEGSYFFSEGVTEAHAAVMSVLLVGALWFLIMAMRSYIELRQTIRLHREGQVRLPVTVERNGRHVRGYLVLPEEDEDEFEDMEGGFAKKEEGLFVPSNPHPAPGKDMQPVVVAKDLI